MPEKNRRNARNVNSNRKANSNRRVSTNKKTNTRKKANTYNNKNTKNENVKNANGAKRKYNKKKIIICSLVAILVLFLIVAGIAAGILFGMFKKYTVPLEVLRTSMENTVIKDLEGNVIATLNASEKRESITLDQMSKYLPLAFISIEDERFYEHDGVDLKRTAAATFKYIFGNSSFGGSTITQQLIKNVTKEDERDATRKIKEIARAYNLEKELRKEKPKSQAKDEILELYLNRIFVGEDVYGVQLAAKLYFNKTAAELDLAESAFIAGINHSPNLYKPFEDSDQMKERIKSRTLTVIEKMDELGKITEEEYNTAIEKVKNGLVFTKGSISENNYSYHVDAVIEQVIKDYQEKYPEMSRKEVENYVYSSGLTIYSTQVTSIQTAMEEEYAKTEFIYKSNKKIKDADGNETDENYKTQSAMTIVENGTGHVVATVGGFGEKTPRGLNRSTQAPHQPGSSIKPLAVIAPSLEAGLITAGTVVDDTPLSGGYTPKNDTGGYNGLMTVREIVRVSRNIPEVKMINKLGPKNSIEFLKKLGITTVDERDENPASALGGLTQGVTTFEMAAAYSTIANDGVYVTPIFYTKVENANGEVILNAEEKQERRRVMSEENAYIVKSILRGPVNSGTAAGLGVKIQGMDTCGKTGTTDNWERWFCGFTPYYSAATWYGYDDYIEVPHNANISGYIWGRVMKKAHEGLEAKSFQKPGNITSATICKDSGLIATDLCKEDPRGSRAISEEFVKGTVPNKSCETHVKEKVCLIEGETEKYKIATDYCPDAIERVFITRPNSDTDRAWEKAADAKYMLPEETCEVHTEPEVEPSPSPSPEPSPTPTPTPKPSPSPVPSPTPTPTPTPTPSVEPPAVTPSPVVVPSPEPTTP